MDRFGACISRASLSPPRRTAAPPSTRSRPATIRICALCPSVIQYRMLEEWSQGTRFAKQISLCQVLPKIEDWRPSCSAGTSAEALAGQEPICSASCYALITTRRISILSRSAFPLREERPPSGLRAGRIESRSASSHFGCSPIVVLVELATRAWHPLAVARQGPVSTRPTHT